jgi:hypothetical protein
VTELILNGIERVARGRNGDRLQCEACGNDLGPADGNYRDFAHRYDLSSDAAQPSRFSNPSGDYVLRHYCCKSCGALFEVDLARVDDQPFESVTLPS